MNADITTLYRSDSYRIDDFRCKSIAGEDSDVEYQTEFSLGFTRKGNYIYNVFRNSVDVYNGRITLNKPDHEHTVNHVYHIPDECTSFVFSPEFYEEMVDRYPNLSTRFFKDDDVQLLVVGSDASMDFLHNRVVHVLKTKQYSRLLIDSLVYEILNSTLGKLADGDCGTSVPSSLKNHHLQTVERAKEYIAANYARDLSLGEIADNSYVSPFHFSRVFRSFTSCSPHRYLMDTRLKNAELMIRNTAAAITDICRTSGFESLEYFSAAFKKKYKMSPSKHRGRI